MMKKNRALISISILLWCCQVFGQEIITQKYMRSKLDDYPLNSRFRAGKNLVYDCEFMHFACVDEISFENCQARRTDDEFAKRTKYNCTPLVKFESKEVCIKKNYEFQSKKVEKKFCFKENN